MTDATPRHVHILIVGAGFSGLGTAIALHRAGRQDYLVVEAGEEVGGTWRDNTYPGVACDVPSHLYSYSFALNPDWSRSFSPQPEIQQYLRDVARRYRVLDRIVFGCAMHSARWDATADRWEVRTSRGVFTADVVISAVGALCEPNLPDIKGINGFQGQIFHSARWDHTAGLSGKRVAVIGTGASAIQIVPSIAGQVAQLDVYQRTPPWVLPRFDRAYTRPERWAFRHIPGLQRALRASIYAFRETQVLGLTKTPLALSWLALMARAKLWYEIRDRRLRAKVTPDFRIGCKRILLSNQYYPALTRPDVEVVTDGIAEVRGRSIVTADGTERPVDVIVVATGFHATDPAVYGVITGRDGRSLAEVFDAEGMQAYKGAVVANFPNMFFLLGPNVGLGHNSMVYMIESQIAYITGALAAMDRHGLRTVEVRQGVQDAYNRTLQQKMARTVWQTGGCASWYLDSRGNNTTLWPDFSFRFRSLLADFDLAAYETTA